MNRNDISKVTELVISAVRAADDEEMPELGDVHVAPDVDANGADIVRIVALFAAEDPDIGAGLRIKVAVAARQYLQSRGYERTPVLVFVGEHEWPDIKAAMPVFAGNRNNSF